MSSPSNYAAGAHSGREIHAHDVDSVSFWKRVDRSGECWLWTGGRRGAYGVCAVGGSRDSGGWTTQPHRAAYALANGVTPARRLVRHICNNKPCVRPDHLVVGSGRDNSIDRRTGDLIEMWDVVKQIRAAPATIPTRRLAAQYGLSVAAVGNILKNRIWVDESYRPKRRTSGPGARTLSGEELEAAYAVWVSSGGPTRRRGQRAGAASIPALAERFAVGAATMYDALHALHDRRTASPID